MCFGECAQEHALKDVFQEASHVYTLCRAKALKLARQAFLPSPVETSKEAVISSSLALVRPKCKIVHNYCLFVRVLHLR